MEEVEDRLLSLESTVSTTSVVVDVVFVEVDDSFFETSVDGAEVVDSVFAAEALAEVFFFNMTSSSSSSFAIRERARLTDSVEQKCAI